MELRAWQVEALRIFSRRSDTDFLCVATPGAGKTRFSAAAVASLLERRQVARVVVVVPSNHLREQWADALSISANIELDPKWLNGHSVWPKDMSGMVVSYQQVASAPLLFRKHCAQSPTVVIFDEIHHCGSEKHWGEKIELAFGNAAKRLSLSGTPFRSDGAPIPFVTYEGGVVKPSFRYSYEQSLKDEICRSVYFPRRGGRMEWSTDKGHFSRDISEKMADIDAARALNTALMPSGEWISEVLRDANDGLFVMRQEDATAGGLVVTKDQDHARAVAKVLAKVSGQTPVIAVSDDAEASQKIRSFVKSREPWIVAVRMVSEGIDIPRLRVCVYATNVVQELTFRQIVGRVVRVQKRECGEASHVYIPDHPELRLMATEIIKERDGVIIDRQPAASRESEGMRTDGFFSPISSNAADNGYVADGEEMASEDLEHAREMIRNAGTKTDPYELALILRKNGISERKDNKPAEAEEAKPAYQRKESLKKRNNQLAKSIAMRFGVEPREVHMHLNGKVCLGTIKHASEKDLERRAEFARKWLETGARP